MFASMGPESMRRANIKPHLVLHIKEGWRFDEKQQAFVCEQQRVDAQSGLPSGTRVEYRIPQLAKAPKGSLSKEEQKLLRYFNVVPRSGSQLPKCLDVVEKWACTEDVEIAPEPEAPNQPGIAPDGLGGA